MEKTNDSSSNVEIEVSSESIQHSLAHLLLGIGVGAVIGVTMSILLAPQKGEKTREDLNALPDQAKKRADEMISELKKSIEELSLKSKDLVDSTRERIEAGMQAGREAAEEKKRELEARVQEEESA